MDNIHGVLEDLKFLKERYQFIETSFGNVARKNNLLTERINFVESSLSERLFLIESVLKEQQAVGRFVDSLNYEQELIIENGHRAVVVETNIDSDEALSNKTI